MARISAEEAGGVQITAFLDMLRWSEIGSAMLALSDDGYNVLVGSTPAKMKTFANYAAHPNVYNPVCQSTAAGGYQFLTRIWTAYQRQLKLPDFSPISQDRAAVQILKERRAIAPLQAGDVGSAIVACSNIWASLPGNVYGQYEHELGSLLAVYNKSLETVA